MLTFLGDHLQDGSDETAYLILVGKRLVQHSRFSLLKHDSPGAPKDCWVFDERSGSIIIASRDMVFFYDADQCIETDGYRGRCLQLGRNNEKLQLVSVGEHLALLTKQQALISYVYFEVLWVPSVSTVKTGVISCLRTRNLLILGKDGTLSELIEKNLSAKLDILLKKNLYDVAVILEILGYLVGQQSSTRFLLGLAKNSKDGNKHLRSIHAKYGDYLYGKCDYDNAINEYKETVGMMEPSYVIKRVMLNEYLDISRLRQLCVYLESLHETTHYNLNHTNILVNCYAQLDERDKMMKFLENLSVDARTNMTSVIDSRAKFLCKCRVYLTYVVFTLVLRLLKLSEDAVILAVKLNMHDHAIAMMVEDLGRHRAAIKYIDKRPLVENIKYSFVVTQTLHAHNNQGKMQCNNQLVLMIYALDKFLWLSNKAYRYTEKYGRELFEACPDETIQLLQKLIGNCDSDPAQLLKVFVNDFAKCADFIEFAIKKNSVEQLVPD
ncbi:hypothetical protein DICVIV_12836 [Dictyocaulus viviparus]|uniref:Uncharacterized protein n=1 Tax=Dictyocaulus viviparus TaxID=29172 RepID=A0A0D8X9F4_DICVI|nr:hypothetical protein DICVIV_12836 [Dictyocaulus viviparus]